MRALITRYVLLVAALVPLALGGAACDDEKGLKIKSISPKTGPADSAGAITIHGNGFKEAGSMGVRIYFGDKKARFLRYEGDKKMIVEAPPGEVGQTVDVQVIFDDGRQHKFPEAYSYINPKEGFNVNALAPGESK